MSEIERRTALEEERAGASRTGVGQRALFSLLVPSSWPRTSPGEVRDVCAPIGWKGSAPRLRRRPTGTPGQRFNLAAAAFEHGGWRALLDERPGRRGPVKLTPRSRRSWPVRPKKRRLGRRPSPGGEQPASGSSCTAHRPNGPGGGNDEQRRERRTFWPIGEPPKADYEMLRAYMLSEGDLPLFPCPQPDSPAWTGRA